MATPFVQGRLRGEKVAIYATTRCSQTDREIRLHIDGDLNVEVLSPDADPYIFEPHLDWKTFSAPNIIHDYWTNSVFFWSEEQAREHRRQPRVIDGAYMTLEQCAFATPIGQGRLFPLESELL